MPWAVEPASINPEWKFTVKCTTLRYRRRWAYDAANSAAVPGGHPLFSSERARITMYSPLPPPPAIVNIVGSS